MTQAEQVSKEGKYTNGDIVYWDVNYSNIYLVFVTCTPQGLRAAGPRAEGVHIR